MILWKRRVSVETAGLTISEVQIKFNLKKEASSSPPTGEVHLFNLSQTTEQQISEKGSKLTLCAGYGDNCNSILYDGPIERIEKTRENLARITKIFLTGEAAKSTDKEIPDKVSLAYTGDTPLRTIVQDAVAQVDRLRLGPLDPIPPDLSFSNFHRVASIQAVLSNAFRGTELTWYEDDGVIKFNAASVTQPGAADLSISPANGLIGSPSTTEDGAKISTLLLPTAQIGASITVESKALQGNWKIISLNHVGDNREGDFRTDMELRPL